MPPLLFPLPTTSLLTFSSILLDPSGTHTSVLAEATSARTQVHLALKAVSADDPGSSALAVVNAVQGYLPYLRGIAACLESDELLLKGEPTFPWRAPLTHYTSTPPLLSLLSIHSEHLFVLLTYTLALSNYAHSILASLPTFESSPGTKPTITTDDEKRTTAGLARAVDLLCQASGVTEWTAEEVCPKVDGIRVGTGGRVGKYKWPIEVGAETMRGLGMTLLADAHVTAVRKLMLPILPHILFAPPGPPLPSNHPSPSLLSKLHLHISTLYTSALAQFHIPTEVPSTQRKLFKSRDTDPEPSEGEIIPQVRRYLRKESVLSSALARKWLGVEAGESVGGKRVGEGVAWVKDAQGRLEELEDSSVREKMKALGIGKGHERRKEERKARKGRVERELEDVAAWVRAYSRMNDTVAFQPVPPISTLGVPSGRPIFAAKPFVPPASKMGSLGEREAVKTEEGYAGKGNYF